MMVVLGHFSARCATRCFVRAVLVCSIVATPSVHVAQAQNGRTSDEGPLEREFLELPDFGPSPEDALLAKRAQLDATVWNKEVVAQQYEQAFVDVWDRLLAVDRSGQGSKWDVLSDLGFESIHVASGGSRDQLDFDVVSFNLDQSPRPLTLAEWKQRLKMFEAAGYRLEQSEFHHARFDSDEGDGAKSQIKLAFYGTKDDDTAAPLRWVVSGTIRVHWRPAPQPGTRPIPRSVDAVGLNVTMRRGPLAFREVLTIDRAQPNLKSGVQPILVADLDGDDRLDIVLGGTNLKLTNQGGFEFKQGTLCKHNEPIFEVGILADFNGDRQLDFVAPGIQGDLLMYIGDDQGRFEDPPLGKARGGGPLRQPQVLTAGDVDQDGDLDLWLGQYMISYVGGQMPTPYFDANDGFPAFLLINDGQGRFQPWTEEAGLAAKRRRRSYGGSLIDLDDDDDLDLVVVSDFSGIDLYRNDGTGRFDDVTDRIDERHLFGMAITFGDYDLDGKLDFFATGMASTTARRLEYMQLGRNDRPEIHQMRLKMAYGNRMYLSRNGKYTQPNFRDQVARTGWTWGATSLDFDNDGDVDIFVANGHSSGKSTKDHCTHFWCHDIYESTNQPDPSLAKVFNKVLSGYSNRTESWDGYQKNALLTNQSGRGFTNFGYLLGVGHQYDGRAVVGDDFDNDGRIDLLVVEDRWNEGQLLHVYRNELETDHHWIGVRLSDRDGRSPMGAKVTILTSRGKQVDRIVTGDSIHAQHATVCHFGLGEIATVERLEVRWSDGTVWHQSKPQVDTYHRPPPQPAAAR